MFDCPSELLTFLRWNPASSFEDTQCLGFFDRLTAFADPELPVDVLQVRFDGY
jgi:hypothetical protein